LNLNIKEDSSTSRSK